MARRDEGVRVTGRYARQVSLPEVGPEGQAHISRANVLVVGAGGLGCAVLEYLAAAGVGRITIVDHDRVEAANLHRQPLYQMGDVGRLKAEAARDALRRLNPGVAVRIECARLTPANAPQLVAAADIVVDAADAFAVTYTLSDECAPARKPLVSASVLGLSGYIGVFCGAAPSYRAVFPELPARAGSCATAGVLGTAVGVVGTMQAHLVLSLILGLEAAATARLVSIDFRSLRIGGFEFSSAREPREPVLKFAAASQVTAGDLTVDLRGLDEAPVPAFESSVRASVDDVERIVSEASGFERIVLCCRSGVRAWQAASRLRALGVTNVALIALGD